MAALATTSTPPRPAALVPILAAALALAACERTPATPARVEVIVAPPADDPVPWIRAQLAAARGRQVVVYVGASWCEPCKHFHDAVAAGHLDAAFPRLTLLEFDQDRDGDGLLRAGYTSRLIPLFVRPAADGTASAMHIEGSIKGDGAVAEITPRLQALLRTPSVSAGPK